MGEIYKHRLVGGGSAIPGRESIPGDAAAAEARQFAAGKPPATENMDWLVAAEKLKVPCAEKRRESPSC